MKKRHPRPVYVNAVQRAIESARKLPAADAASLKAIVSQAFDQLKLGIECKDNWRNIADALNIAEALSELGICSDPDSRGMISAGHHVLGVLVDRHNTRGSWAMRADEMQALDDALFLHRAQLDFCSLGEYERANRRVAERTRQALRGNAGPGVQVVQA